jgi:hypothetical protein
MSQFKIEIASVPDRENLVAEIWYSEVLIAEINQEKENLEIQLYPVDRISVKLEEYLDALHTAKKDLLGE